MKKKKEILHICIHFILKVIYLHFLSHLYVVYILIDLISILGRVKPKTIFDSSTKQTASIRSKSEDCLAMRQNHWMCPSWATCLHQPTVVSGLLVYSDYKNSTWVCWFTFIVVQNRQHHHFRVTFSRLDVLIAEHVLTWCEITIIPSLWLNTTQCKATKFDH